MEDLTGGMGGVVLILGDGNVADSLGEDFGVVALGQASNVANLGLAGTIFLLSILLTGTMAANDEVAVEIEQSCSK